MSGVRRDCQHTKVHHVHGTLTAYNQDRCRCDDCRAANAARVRRVTRAKAYGQHKPTYVDPLEARRLLDSLRLTGRSMPDLAKRLGISTQALWLVYTVPRISRVKLVRIRALHDELELRRPVMRGQAVRAVTFAAKRGAVPAAAFDDLSDPDAKPAVWRDRGRLRPSVETAGEYEHLRGFGLSDEQVAARLGLTVDGLQKALRRAA